MSRILSIILSVTTLVAMCGVASAQKKANPQVTLETSKGTIVVELYPDKAPITVKNFLQYANDKFFDGLIFHRVIKGFMVQGGGFTPDMVKKPTRSPIKLEAGNGLSNKRGTIAMARTAVKDSATSQFFINHVDNARLDKYGGGYAVFGKVVSGMDVVDKIAQVATTRKGGHANVPTEPVLLKSVTVKK